MKPCGECRAAGALEGEHLPACATCDPVGYFRFEREQLDYREDTWLRAHGWEYKSIGATWLWVRKLSEGRTLLVRERSSAIWFEVGGFAHHAEGLF